ncbi:MAG: hypothetical protein ACPGD8_00920 [Flavobacteriales bacterium]
MITKEEIALSNVPLHSNVDDDKVLHYIDDAVQGLVKVIGNDLFDALATLNDEGVQNWAAANGYVANKKAIEKERFIAKMWKSLTTNSDSKPSSTNTTDWEEVELGTLLFGYVKPYLAHAAFYPYAVNGGVNVTHQGLQTISNETASALDGSSLQSYLNFWKRKTDVARTEMAKHIEDKSNLFDGVSYTAIDGSVKKRRFTISGA